MPSCLRHKPPPPLAGAVIFRLAPLAGRLVACTLLACLARSCLARGENMTTADVSEPKLAQQAAALKRAEAAGEASTNANATTTPLLLVGRELLEARDGLEALLRVVNDTRGASNATRRRIQALLEQQPARRVQFEDTIFMKRAPKEIEAKMNMSFEGESRSEPAIHWMILHNETTILVVRSANKYYYWTYGQTASALIIFCFIVVGNSSILHRLKSHRRRRSNVNYFIVQLAIADLLVGIFSITLDSLLRIQKAFTWGLFACRASKYISVLFIYSSTNLLVALSVDRWEAVVKPLAFTRNRSRGYQLVAGSWLLAFVAALPVTFFTTIKEIDGLPQCWIDLDNFGWRVYLIYLTSSLLVIPTCLIAICYIHIVYTIWSKARLVDGQRAQRGRRALPAAAPSTPTSSSPGGKRLLVHAAASSSSNERLAQAAALAKPEGDLSAGARLKSSLRSGGASGGRRIERSCAIEAGASEQARQVKFNGRQLARQASEEAGHERVASGGGALTSGRARLPEAGALERGCDVVEIQMSAREIDGRAANEARAQAAGRPLDENNNAPPPPLAVGRKCASLSTLATNSSEASTSSGGSSVSSASTTPPTSPSARQVANDVITRCERAPPIAAQLRRAGIRNEPLDSTDGASTDVEAPADQLIARAAGREPRKWRRAKSEDLGGGGGGGGRAPISPRARAIDGRQRRRRSAQLALQVASEAAENNNEAAAAENNDTKPQQQASSMISCDISPSSCWATKTPSVTTATTATTTREGSLLTAPTTTTTTTTATTLAPMLAGRKKKRKKRKKKKGRERSAKEQEAIARGLYVAQQHGSGVIPKARIKTIKMTLVIVVAYILCWSPFLILNLCNVFGLFKNDTTVSHALMTLSQSLAHLNSAVNPIIFWLFSSRRHNNGAGSCANNNNNNNNNNNAATTVAVGAATAAGNGGLKSGNNGSNHVKVGRPWEVMHDWWAQLKWLLTCCHCCCFQSSTGTSRRPFGVSTDSRLFDRTATTTTTRFGSQISAKMSIEPRALEP